MSSKTNRQTGDNRGMARSFQWMVVFLSLTTCLWAQEKRPRIQVQHYSIDADINPRTQSLSATAKVTFLPLEATSAVVFELNSSLNVSKVLDSQGQNIPTNRDKDEGTIRLMMPVTLTKNQPVTVTFTYDGRVTGNEDGPVPGIKFAALHPEN